MFLDVLYSKVQLKVSWFHFSLWSLSCLFSLCLAGLFCVYGWSILLLCLNLTVNSLENKNWFLLKLLNHCAVPEVIPVKCCLYYVDKSYSWSQIPVWLVILPEPDESFSNSHPDTSVAKTLFFIRIRDYYRHRYIGYKCPLSMLHHGNWWKHVTWCMVPDFSVELLSGLPTAEGVREAFFFSGFTSMPNQRVSILLYVASYASYTSCWARYQLWHLY